MKTEAGSKAEENALKSGQKRSNYFNRITMFFQSLRYSLCLEYQKLCSYLKYIVIHFRIEGTVRNRVSSLDQDLSK